MASYCFLNSGRNANICILKTFHWVYWKRKKYWNGRAVAAYTYFWYCPHHSKARGIGKMRTLCGLMPYSVRKCCQSTGALFPSFASPVRRITFLFVKDIQKLFYDYAKSCKSTPWLSKCDSLMWLTLYMIVYLNYDNRINYISVSHYESSPQPSGKDPHGKSFRFYEMSHCLKKHIISRRYTLIFQ